MRYSTSKVNGVLMETSGPRGVPKSNLEVRSRHGALVQIAFDGSYRYEPTPGFAGVDTFSYPVALQSGEVENRTVTVTVPARQPRQIAIDFDAFVLLKTRLRGEFTLRNLSEGLQVQVSGLEVLAHYQALGRRGLAPVNLTGCEFDPQPGLVFSETQLVEFSSCRLPWTLPLGARLVVTVRAKVFGGPAGQVFEAQAVRSIY